MLGTVLIYHDASRPTQLEQSESRRLKYGSGPVPVILVPQPSDDPNDPLVRNQVRYRHMLTEVELATMETRPGI